MKLLALRAATNALLKAQRPSRIKERDKYFEVLYFFLRSWEDPDDVSWAVSRLCHLSKDMTTKDLLELV